MPQPKQRRSQSDLELDILFADCITKDATGAPANGDCKGTDPGHGIVVAFMETAAAIRLLSDKFQVFDIVFGGLFLEQFRNRAPPCRSFSAGLLGESQRPESRRIMTATPAK